MKKDGFTLIELLAVIVILGIIIGISVPGINSVINTSRRKALDSEAKLIKGAVINKRVAQPEFDFSIVNKDNIRNQLEIEKGNYDSAAITVGEDDEWTIVTLEKGGYFATSEKDGENPIITLVTYDHVLERNIVINSVISYGLFEIDLSTYKRDYFNITAWAFYQTEEILSLPTSIDGTEMHWNYDVSPQRIDDMDLTKPIVALGVNHVG